MIYTVQDVLGLGAAISGIADEVSEVLDVTDSSIYSKKIVTTTKNKVIVEHFNLSLLKIAGLTIFSYIIIKTFQLWMNGEDWYDYLWEKMDGWRDRMFGGEIGTGSGSVRQIVNSPLGTAGGMMLVGPGTVAMGHGYDKLLHGESAVPPVTGGR